jgi:hypothetical protein
VTLLAWLTASIFVAIAGCHVYWALGGRRGATDAVPHADGKPLFEPGTATTLSVAVLLLLAALLVLERARLGPGIVPPALGQWGTWTVAAVLTARAVGEFNHVGFFKRSRPTRFSTLDTRVYSPLALLLAIAAAVIAWAA